MSRGMWKPGEAKPEEGSSSQKSPPSSSKRSLSGATRAMRFMQRKSLSPEPMDISDTEQDTSTDKMDSRIATNVEMYGKERSKLVGRRSFGGFNKAVAELHYTQVQYELHHHKRTITDAELIQRAADREYDEQASNRKKKRPQSISSTNKRKRKA